MRYSKAAASLLSTVFAFRAKSATADIFNGVDAFAPTVINADVNALAPTENVNDVDAGISSVSSTATIELKHKCKASEVDCVHGSLRTRTDANAADAGLLNTTETAAKGSEVAPSGGIVIASTAPTNSDAADTGILAAATAADAAAPMIALAATPSTCAAANIVVCVDGYLATQLSTSCSTECGSACCVGTDACFGFTGKVCKDSNSCMGDKSCKGAAIPSVVFSCSGENACYFAGYNGGSIGKIVDSCIGIKACEDLGRYYGKVGNILNSCLGNNACYHTASEGGLIGSITDSCNEGDEVCYSLGETYGNVGNVLNSCKGVDACRFGAYQGGSIGNIANSCTVLNSCTDLGQGRGKVGHVTGSCTGENSCRNAGSKRGSIGNISDSCKSNNACDMAGSGSTGGITSNLMKCCNNIYECVDDTQSTLPATCKAPAPGPPPASKSAKKRVR